MLKLEKGREDGVFRLLGGAYIHGVMHGKAFHGIENQEELQEISEVFFIEMAYLIKWNLALGLVSTSRVIKS